MAKKDEQIMQIILVLLSLIDRIMAAVQEQRRIAKQEGRLTAEQDAELDQRLETMFQSKAWKTDDQIEE